MLPSITTSSSNLHFRHVENQTQQSGVGGSLFHAIFNLFSFSYPWKLCIDSDNIFDIRKDILSREKLPFSKTVEYDQCTLNHEINWKKIEIEKKKKKQKKERNKAGRT